MSADPLPFQMKATPAPEAPKVQPPAVGSRRYARMNSVTGRLLVVLCLLSAVPLASNRPSWWLASTFLIAIGSLIYLVRAQYLMGSRRNLQVTQMRVFFGLALVVPAYAILQSMPIAAFIPADWLALPELVPTALQPASISIAPDASLLGAIRAAGFLLFLVLVIEIGTQPERSRNLILLLALGIALHAAYGIVALRILDDFVLWGEKTAYRGALTGTFVNRNSFATFLGFGLVLTLALAMERAYRSRDLQKSRGIGAYLTLQKIEVLGFILLCGLFALALPLTQSRAGLVAAVFGCFVTFIALRLKFRTSVFRVALEATGAFALLVLVLLPTTGESLIERALFTFASTDDRAGIYQIAMTMIADRPVTGFGYDTFAAAFQIYRDEMLISPSYYDLAHNSYLTLWIEQGVIIGSIPILLAIWAAGVIIARLRRADGDPAVLAGALGVLTLASVHSLADFSLEMPAVVYCYLLILGLAIAPRRG
jgi:O-antigen ligase